MAEVAQYDWAQTEPDVRLMLVLREARQRMLARLAASATNTAAFAGLVHTQREVVFLIAEFFFAVRALESGTPMPFGLSSGRIIGISTPGFVRNSAARPAALPIA